MSIVIGTITDKIVEVMRNDETKSFVGKRVCYSAQMSTYYIEGTKYVLTGKEVNWFISEKVIRESRKKPKPQNQRVQVKTSVNEKTSAATPKINLPLVKPQQAQKTVKATVSPVAPVKTAKDIDITKFLEDDSEAVESSVEMKSTAEWENYKYAGYTSSFSPIGDDDSEFFKSYKPEFDLGKEKRAHIFDVFEDIAAKFSRKVDKAGKSAKDSIVKSLEDSSSKMETRKSE